MLGALALLGLAALASSPRRHRLGDAPALPSGDAPSSGTSAYLLRPADFAHPAARAQVEAKAESEGGPWAVVPSTGWAGARHFRTAKEARIALTAAGFKGPYGKGASSRWTR